MFKITVIPEKWVVKNGYCMFIDRGPLNRKTDWHEGVVAFKSILVPWEIMNLLLLNLIYMCGI